MNNINPKLNFDSNILERRYLYLPMISREKRKNKNLNLYEKIKSMEDKPILEQIAEKDDEVLKKKRSLHIEKKALMKKLLIDNKNILSAWKAKLDFSDYVEEALKDDYVLSQVAQHIKDDANKRKYAYKVLTDRTNSEICNPFLMQNKFHSIRENTKARNHLLSISNQQLLKSKMYNNKMTMLDNNTNNNTNHYNKKKLTSIGNAIKEEETVNFFLVTQNEMGTIRNKEFKFIKSFSSP